MQSLNVGTGAAGGDAARRADMLDLAPYRSERTIVHVTHDPSGVTLRWDDGGESRFHALWLRDNCPCPRCRHPHTLERQFLLVEVADSVAIGCAALTASGDLEVRFAAEGAGQEAHVSRFAAAWLAHHDCSQAVAGETEPAERLWDAALGARLPEFEHRAVMGSDDALQAWLTALLERGIALVRGAPAAAGELARIAERIGPPRLTNFGTVFDVRSVPQPKATADTATGLEPHTDFANWNAPADYLLLFCVANEAKGGDSIVVDGFRVAEALREEDPEAFAVLASRPIDFRFHDEACDIRAQAPTIELDPNGRVGAVRFNNWLRAAPAAPAADVEPIYRALVSFWRRLRDRRFHVRLRLSPGELLVIDNRRVLHGRDPFDPTTGRRHFQGCHVDRDWVLSRLRLLERAAPSTAARS